MISTSQYHVLPADAHVVLPQQTLQNQLAHLYYCQSAREWNIDCQFLKLQ
jgi:hypothetical protein